MNSSRSVVAVLAVTIAAAWLTYYVAQPPDYPGLVCAKQPVTTLGPARQSAAFAELTAIVKWKRRSARTRSAAYSDWHNARRRSLKCHTLTDGNQVRCRVTAMPCRAAWAAMEAAAAPGT